MLFRSSSAALKTDQILSDGVRSAPDIRAIATRSDHGVEVLVWNYHDDDVSAAPDSVDLTIRGLPAEMKRALLQHYRIDSNNAFSAWKQMGSPQTPSPEQYKQLEGAGQLQLLTSPQWIQADGESATVKFDLPRQGLSLIKIEW